jgi:hypothetical protein
MVLLVLIVKQAPFVLQTLVKMVALVSPYRQAILAAFVIQVNINKGW